MRRSVFFIYALTGVLMSFAEQTNISVSVSFETRNPPQKTRQYLAPKCLIKCGETIDSFSYCGAEELTSRILEKFHIGQTVELSMLGYPSSLEVAKILAILNSKNLFAYAGSFKPEYCSSSNALRGGALDRLVVFTFSEARAIYRRERFEKCQPLQSDFCIHVDKFPKCGFTNFFSSDICVRNVAQRKQKVINTRNSIFFPDLDLLQICPITESRKILAECHFVGGNIFPFEGVGRALSPELKSIVTERLVKIEFEERLRREFGGEYDNLSEDALIETIYNSPNKDRILEMLHSDIAETGLGVLDYLGCISVMISPNTSFMSEICSCDVFATSDRNLLFITHNGYILCMWMIFDKVFWEM